MFYFSGFYFQTVEEMSYRKKKTRNLVEAAEQGLLEEVQYYCDKKPKIMKKYSECPYSSPIYKAALYGHVKIVKYLWQEGKSCISLNSPRKTTPNSSNSLQTVQTNYSQSICESTNSEANLEIALLGAVEYGSMEIIEYLIIHGCSLNRWGADKKTALHFAAAKGDLKIVKFLVEKGAHVNCRDAFGKTPLFYAISSGFISIIRYLIEAKTNIHIQQIYTNETAFVYAIRNGSFDIIEILLDAGSDINIKSVEGENVLFEAIRNCSFQVVELLINRKIDVNVSDEYNGKSALYYAIKLDKFDVFRLLIESGANVNHVDNDKHSLFHYAAINNKIQYAEILIEKGAVVHINNQVVHYTNANDAVRDYLKSLDKTQKSLTSVNPQITMDAE